MLYEIKARVLNEANYIIKTRKTIRELSKYFKVSKSTVHNDLSYRLRLINFKLYNKVNKILVNHYQIKHLNGGKQTKLKYLKGQK